jgi:exo-poly-alpha-galacturonosidase
MPNRAPDGLAVLSQSLDSGPHDNGTWRVTLVWSKPGSYRSLTDYAVYAQSRPAGSTDAYSAPERIGPASHNILSPAQKGFDTFYGDPSNADAVKVQSHNYIASGLESGRDYQFTVRGITNTGATVALDDSYQTTLSTPADQPQRFVVNADGYGGIAGVPSAADGGALQYTAAIQSALNDAKAAAASSGHATEVDIPKGVHLISGAISLGSNTTLRVDGTLTESLDLSLITPAGLTATNGTKYSTFVNIAGTSRAHLQNVRLVGTGTIDGQGWQYLKDAPDVEYASQLGLAESKEATYETVVQNGLLDREIYQTCVDAGGAPGNSTCYGKRPNLVGGTQADHVYVGGGLRLENPGNSISGFSYVSDYVVNGVTYQSFNGNNGDSINVSRFSGFTALNNVVNSGDDNIVMNAGNSREQPVGSAWVFDNYLARGHGGVAFGSGTSSWVDNVQIEDNVMVQTSDGIRAKSKPGSGGGVRFVTVRDLAMKDLTNLVGGHVDPLVVGYQMDGAAFIFTTHYPGAYASTAWPVYHDWNVSHVSVDGSTTAGIIVDGLHDDALLQQAGIPFLPSNNLHFSDVTFKGTGIPLIDSLAESSFDNVTFHDPRGKVLKDAWNDVADATEVTVDGTVLPDAPQLTARPDSGAYHGQSQGLTFTSTGSFDRFYQYLLPDDVRTRVGTIKVDGTALDAADYPQFQPKVDDGGLIAGTDATVNIAAEFGTNVHTVFTFRPAFLSSLKPGKHTVEFVFSNGTASAQFQVAANILHQ